MSLWLEYLKKTLLEVLLTSNKTIWATKKECITIVKTANKMIIYTTKVFLFLCNATIIKKKFSMSSNFLVMGRELAIV